MELRILSVNVGQPRIIGTRVGAPLISAIGKSPVAGPEIHVYMLGLAGDAQANPRVHGGADKAVYAYPSDHWPWWEKEHRLHSRPASFGENLTLAGADETQVRIGGRFAWGDLDLKNDIDGAAALSDACDLVISAPTAAAALAGAIGKPVWFLVAGRVWPQLGTEEYPWYASSRVFFPSKFGEWSEVMPQVANALQAFAAERTRL